jgi:hypothetical protein
LGDSKGVGHFFTKDTSTYHQPEVRKIMNRQFVRVGLLHLSSNSIINGGL